VPSDPDTYMHRIGRTGRAGKSGLALTLCTPDELRRMEAIEDHQFRTLPRERGQPVDGRPKGVPRAAMATLRIDAGKGDRLRPGDILGALTGDAGLSAKAIGKIDVQATRSYVAIARAQAPLALARLREGKIKGRRFRVAAL
jgi:ATP-independent RNA helicase DbpA